MCRPVSVTKSEKLLLCLMTSQSMSIKQRAAWTTLYSLLPNLSTLIFLHHQRQSPFRILLGALFWGELCHRFILEECLRQFQLGDVIYSAELPGLLFQDFLQLHEVFFV